MDKDYSTRYIYMHIYMYLTFSACLARVGHVAYIYIHVYIHVDFAYHN